MAASTCYSRRLDKLTSEGEDHSTTTGGSEADSDNISQYIALQIMNNLITTRWKTLPVDQRSGIRNFIVQVVIKIASTDDEDPNAANVNNPAAAAYLHTNSPREKTAFMNKINLIVVQILKQEWPSGTWPNAIDEIVTSSKNNLGLCENNMIILRLLSEEVFDYSAETMSEYQTSTS